MGDSSANFQIESVIAVGRYIASHGPVVKTRDAAKVYQQEKMLESKEDSIGLYEMLCKYRIS